ncbi:MAG: DoxX family protein [Bacteroidota bacterium]
MKKNYFDWGVLLLRLWLAIVFFKSSIPGLLQPDTIIGFSQYLEALGVPFPLVSAYAARTAELLGALSLLTGFYFHIGSLLIAWVMTIATFIASGGQLFGEGQVPFTYLLIALFFFLAGPGQYTYQLIRKTEQT